MFTRLSVYVVAHQDDWQLFMDPVISDDILNPQCKTVLILTTAGDAGSGRKYWLAREKGTVNSLLFRLSNKPNLTVKNKFVSIRNKKVALTTVNNSSFYFLRLPDGGMEGKGFPQYNNQSLSKIRLGAIDCIKTVDSISTYDSFLQISQVINDLVKLEMRSSHITRTEDVTVHFPEFDHTINPKDHNDHFNTALLLQSADVYRTAKKYAYVHYETQHAAPKLIGTNLFWKIGMFCVYHQTVLTLYGHSTIDESPEYNVWCTKETMRREIA